jgi:hypothetical protein
MSGDRSRYAIYVWQTSKHISILAAKGSNYPFKDINRIEIHEDSFDDVT